MRVSLKIFDIKKGIAAISDARITSLSFAVSPLLSQSLLHRSVGSSSSSPSSTETRCNTYRTRILRRTMAEGGTSGLCDRRGVACYHVVTARSSRTSASQRACRLCTYVPCICTHQTGHASSLQLFGALRY